jgi:hypothetical protein
MGIIGMQLLIHNEKLQSNRRYELPLKGLWLRTPSVDRKLNGQQGDK